MTLDELNAALIRPPFPKLSGNIYCIGRNYGEHVQELGNDLPKEPLVFLKAPSALRPMHSEALACSHETFHHELELVLLIKEHQAMGEKADPSLVGAMTLGLDLTRRELQTEIKKQGLPWTLCKSFAGAAILHPFQNAPKDMQDIAFSLKVKGELRQTGHSKDMIFDVRRILNFLLKYQDLHAGDLVYTGTPAGVGPLQKGDSFQFLCPALGIDADGVL